MASTVIQLWNENSRYLWTAHYGKRAKKPHILSDIYDTWNVK
jgi:hypothetical protein